jgi:nucleosome binding factor SPN SPT16 subunit
VLSGGLWCNVEERRPPLFHVWISLPFPLSSLCVWLPPPFPPFLLQQLKIDRTMRIPRLQDLNLWPVVSGRKTVGSLEAHANGLRFVTNKGERVDIIYRNVRHAIFQPCKKEHNVLIHFHLRHPILINRKKRKDVQFYTEVVEQSQVLDGRRRSNYDADEYEEERREQALRQTLNKAFKRFCDKVEAVTERPDSGVKTFVFDQPSREAGFYGVPHKEMVQLMPCTDALVALVDRPVSVLLLLESGNGEGCLRLSCSNLPHSSTLVLFLPPPPPWHSC